MKVPALKFSELLNRKESLYSQLDRLWNFYIGVTTVTGGWLFPPRKALARLNASVYPWLFCCFTSPTSGEANHACIGLKPR